MTMLAEVLKAGVKLTPMMKQYTEIKKDFPETMVLFRMGDFYELFFEDAKKASRILNIALTHRGKLGDFPIPMAGIPHHAASTYIDRITAAGMKAAICEQVQDPKEAKGIVKRAVTQVVSPSMPFDLEKTLFAETRYIASGAKLEDKYYLVFLDFITGNFHGTLLSSEDEVIEQLRLYQCREFVSYYDQWENCSQLKEILTSDSVLVTHLSQEMFIPEQASIYIEKLIPTYKRDHVLQKHPALLQAIGGLAYYIISTQSLDELYHIKPFAFRNRKDKMIVTQPTLTGLEILPKNREDLKNSLLGFFNRTKTAMGSRELKAQFHGPSKDKNEIDNRLDFTEKLIKEYECLKELRENLAEIRDVERILAKITTKKATPGDLINLAQAFRSFEKIDQLIKTPKKLIPAFTSKEITTISSICEKIEKTINDEMGAALDKGNLIKKGSCKKRDRLAKLALNATDEVLNLETQYRSSTGIGNLKIKHNNVDGYFIEVSKSNTSKVPKHFDRRKTLVNSERYQTEELLKFENDVIAAKDKLYRLEKELYDGILKLIINDTDKFIKLANSIGLIDFFQAIAWTSFQEDMNRPTFTDKKQVELKGAWHPLVREKIKDLFVPHDLTLDDKVYFGLITGPNMAGKTTVMREMAIIQFLAQLGSYVPAKSAKLGICDYLFSRLGASDDITKGQSTFMVEMSETAEIIRHATENSLIVLDEIGRGTSTYDGISIAWALVEHLVQKTKALTLFSTHYHELIELADELPAAKNLTVETCNKGGHVEFLYHLIEQGATQSFGIHVAKLAGLPREILLRSRQKLNELEKEKHHNQQLNFFAVNEPVEIEQTVTELQLELDALDISSLTPLQALNKLNELKEIGKVIN